MATRKTTKKTSRILEDRLHIPAAWKDAVLQEAYHQVIKYDVPSTLAHRVMPLDKVTREFIKKRVDRLAIRLGFYLKSSDYLPAAEVEGPFSPFDGAALILYPRKRAVALLRKLISDKRVRDNIIHEDDDNHINLDWFYFTD